MGDLEDRLRKRIEEGNTPGRLLGATLRALPAGEAAQRLQERAAQESSAPMTVYFVFDTTNSMESYIDAVRNCASFVGREVLSVQKGIEATVWGVGEHDRIADADYVANRRIKFARTSGRRFGDYGQDNIPTTDINAFVGQVKTLVTDEEFNNGDTPEAYECVAAALAKSISEDKARYPGKKHVVVFFGDSYPHQIECGFNDYGCPDRTRPEQLTILGAVADRTYWVDCLNDSNDFKRGTFGAVQNISAATYLKFADAQGVLPEALIGMVKQAQSPDALAEYLRALPGEKGSQVAGLLGAGPSGPK